MHNLHGQNLLVYANFVDGNVEHFNWSEQLLA